MTLPIPKLLRPDRGRTRWRNQSNETNFAMNSHTFEGDLTMKTTFSLKPVMALLAAMLPGLALAFNSGSTGADGAFNPTVNTVVQIPASGVFNYTTVNIPAGVTVSYTKNTANTPLTILVSGDVTIAGTLNVSGGDAAAVGAAGTGNQGDDGQSGAGGPGGFTGGRGGRIGTIRIGGSGLGPGGGSGGDTFLPVWPCVDGNGGSNGGTGGGYASAAVNGERTSFNCNATQYTQILGGSSYGSNLLLPLIGGSGGGGGGAGPTYEGGGGGGGGGAILIASGGTVSVTGALLANGGAGGTGSGAGIGGAGGGGSGGAIRIIATTLTGNGAISAAGGGGGDFSGQTFSVYRPSGGAPGRVRFEAETITRTAGATPLATSDAPGAVFVAGLPTLQIASVGGQNAPANPTGNADLTFPANLVNPVTVTFTTTGVPLGNTVLLSVTPAYGGKVTAQSPAIAGTVAAGTASVQVSLPSGPSTLSATTTYTIVASLGDIMSRFANNERVERVQLTASLGGQSMAKLITVSGKEFDVPASVLAMLGTRG